MPRKVSSGKVGRPVLGDIFTQDNSIRSVEVNANIVLTPDGTGVVESASDIQTNAQSGIRFADSDSSNYVKLRGAAAIGTNLTLTLPTVDGSANQALITDGSGNLSFANNFLAIANRTAADGATYYVAMTDSTTGTEDTLSIADDRMSFVPNPGRLTVNYLTVSTDATVSNDLVVTADLSAATITETSSIAYKENVNPITNALDTILQLQGVTYDRKNTDHKGEAGLIAEEVAPVLPNVVSFKDGQPEGINYTKLTAYLIEAVKTLNEKLENKK